MIQMFHLKAFGLVCPYITECLWVLFALLRIIFPHKCVELEPLKVIKQEGENMDFASASVKHRSMPFFAFVQCFIRFIGHTEERIKISLVHVDKMIHVVLDNQPYV